MKMLKRSLTMLVMLLLMSFVLVACGNNEEKETEPATSNTAAAEDAEDNSTDEVADGETIITEEEAIELVKKNFEEEFSYIPADELEEKDGSEYYVIYVKKLLEEGTMTTMATYMVKTDGSEVFDKDAVSYAGEYVRSGEAGEVTFVVSEDGTFEMTTTGEVNQVVTGAYKVGVTNSPSVIKLLLYPQKNVVDGTEQGLSSTEGTVVIEGDKLTLAMESEETVFTKK
ncbi:MAG: hypothetical protein E7270_03065 [Lachnospiraceae bacterium]|nr:hypothetical protein [Lachnospiraceae bacterium]